MKKWLPINKGGKKIAVTIKMDETDVIALVALTAQLKGHDSTMSQHRIIKTGLRQIPEFKQALKRVEQEREAYESNKDKRNSETDLEKAVRREAKRVK